MVAEAGAVAGVLAQQAVQRHRRHVGQPALVGRPEARGGRAHRLLEPRGGLAGRRGQCDAQALAPGLGLLDEDGQQARDRRRLAGAGSAGDHGGGLRGRPPAGLALLVGLRGGEDPHQRLLEQRGVDGVRAPAPARAGRPAPGSPARGSGRGRPGRGPGAPPRRPAAGSPRRPRTTAPASGHGSPRSAREAGTAARSRQTEPWRTARTARATASRTDSSRSPARPARASWRRGRRPTSARRRC